MPSFSDAAAHGGAFVANRADLDLGRSFVRNADVTDELMIAGALLRPAGAPRSTGQIYVGEQGKLAGPADLERLAGVLLGAALALREAEYMSGAAGREPKGGTE